MSNSAANLYDLINVAQGQIDNIAAVEYPAAGLTLTRSSTLAITTASTTITWQVETRGYGISWAGTTITIPSSGYYNIFVTIATVTNTTMYIRLLRSNFNPIAAYIATPFPSANGFNSIANFTVYFTTGVEIQISCTPSANTTVNVNVETTAGASPIVHIVQLTGSVE